MSTSNRSSPAGEEDDDPISKALDLESLDADALFSALTGVEKAIPELLLSVKPILAHLSSPYPLAQGTEPDGGEAAKEAIERYMNLLDKIQFVLRQTVYYLRETRVSPNTLRPPLPTSIPTPFAASLAGAAVSRGDIDVDVGGEETPVELGLYASRIEARTLKAMGGILKQMREAQADGDGSSSMTIDSRTPAAAG